MPTNFFKSLNDILAFIKGCITVATYQPEELPHDPNIPIWEQIGIEPEEYLGSCYEADSYRPRRAKNGHTS